ncbi:MAG: hypothetical protein V3V59_06890 [Thermodesulfovibrionales bacterium]
MTTFICGNNAPEFAGRVRSDPLYVLMRQITSGEEIVETKIDIRRGD